MDGDKVGFVNETVLHTPKPTACSTVDKKSFQRKIAPRNIDDENSLGIINISDVSMNAVDLSCQLEQQRVLASNSLQRANKVSGLPSKYLRPNMSSSSISNITTESTISDRDLTGNPRKAPQDTSTPRSSVASNSSDENSLPRLSLGQSMAQLSYQIGNTDISIDNFVKEFQKVMSNVDKGAPQIDSKLFSPAEEAASMLLADEMSWRRQNEMPLTNNFSQASNEDVSYGKVSVGQFFQQKSDTLSDFKLASSPVKSKNPIPLIDASISFAEESRNEKDIEKKSKKSLSISAIQKLLAESDDTPRKVTSFLLKQGQKSNEIDQLSLPVSKNSSYTSNYSDNEVMRHIVAEKENIDTCNIPQRDTSTKKIRPESQNRPMSAGSTRSSSALTSLPEGKLPIESTKTELIWGCVKMGKCATQDFLLRNRTAKRLCLQMSVTGHDFKIRKDNRQESEPLSAAKILLHPCESRAIIVSFIPTRIGAAVDELNFTSLDPNLQQSKKQSVRLFGYGGFGKVDILNLTKDITGKFWLSLGKLDNHNVITQKFVIKNTGTLPCFAFINFSAKELFAFANVSVSPSFSVLLPNESKEIIVNFILTMEDHQVLQHSMFTNTMVVEIGSLLMISGTEVNRGRLRRQCRKCIEKGLEIDPMANILKEKIKGETMPSDLGLFKEASGSLKEILKLFSRSEIVMTIEQDPEVTIMPQFPDESGMFHTLCQDTTTANLETTTTQTSYKLEPVIIILSPPTKTSDSLFLVSECKKSHFEVVCNPEGLEIFPREGIVVPGQEAVINVACTKLLTNEKKVFKVLVYVESEVIEATVKIIFIHGQ